MNEEYIDLAVAGLHLTGQPLNHQLTGIGGFLKNTGKTKNKYHMYLIEDTRGIKPALIRVPYNQEGFGYDVEIWSIPISKLANFLSQIPAPLGLGKVELQDESIVTGFICEPCVLMEGKDISGFPGWKGYLAHLNSN